MIEVLEGDEVVGLLQHHVKHSPTGLSWGYGGSGPADTARSLLIDHFGKDAWCARCQGQGRLRTEALVEDGEMIDWVPVGPAQLGDDNTIGCDGCWGEKTSFSPSLYQNFKFAIVAKLPQSETWSLTAAEIDAWLVRQP